MAPGFAAKGGVGRLAYIYQRGKTWWVGFIDKHGRAVRQSAKTTLKSKAERFAEELEHKHRRIREGVDADAALAPTLVELAQRYLNGPVKRNSSYGTLEQRIRDHVIPVLGARRADLITAADINELLNAMLSASYSPQTAEHVRIAISGIYTYGVDSNLVRSSPMGKVTPVRIPEREPRTLDAIYIPRLVANVPLRWRTLFAVAVYTGLRKGELLGLLCECVDLRGRRILVLRSYDGPTKSKKDRVVPIPEELVPFLKDALEKTADRYLFPAIKGGMQNRNANLPRTFRNAMKRAGIVQGYQYRCRRQACRWVAEKLSQEARPGRCEKCGFMLYAKPIPLDLAFKDLRSTYGTYAYEATDDIRFVQRVLGHGDPKLTERIYAKLTAKRLLEQGDKLRFGTHTLLTPTAEVINAVATGGSNMKQLPSVTTTRSRGLEPLTSGVTGRSQQPTKRWRSSLPVTINLLSSKASGQRLTPKHRQSASDTHTLLTRG